jgi:hypothetical protein
MATTLMAARAKTKAQNPETPRKPDMAGRYVQSALGGMGLVNSSVRGCETEALAVFAPGGRACIRI